MSSGGGRLRCSTPWCEPPCSSPSPLFPILATPYAANTITVFGYEMDPVAGYRVALWIGAPWSWPPGR